jgi:hypothetical protein
MELHVSSRPTGKQAPEKKAGHELRELRENNPNRKREQETTRTRKQQTGMDVLLFRLGLSICFFFFPPTKQMLSRKRNNSLSLSFSRDLFFLCR